MVLRRILLTYICQVVKYYNKIDSHYTIMIKARQTGFSCIIFMIKIAQIMDYLKNIEFKNKNVLFFSFK